jgi:hypothetical protein
MCHLDSTTGVTGEEEVGVAGFDGRLADLRLPAGRVISITADDDGMTNG